MDERTKEAVQRLGLPVECRELQALLEKVWSELDAKGNEGEDEDMRERHAFVTIPDRAIGAGLEHNHDAVLKAASKI